LSLLSNFYDVAYNELKRLLLL